MKQTTSEQKRSKDLDGKTVTMYFLWALLSIGHSGLNDIGWGFGQGYHDSTHSVAQDSQH